jgi:hypothetical protein
MSGEAEWLDEDDGGGDVVRLGDLTWLRRVKERAAAYVPPPPPTPEEVEAQRRAEVVAERRRRLERAGVPDRDACELMAAAVEPPVVAGHAGSAAALAGVAEFLARPELRTLTLRGPTGSGKTWAAVWAIACEGGYWLAADECTADAERWHDIADRARDAGLLVVNDIGSERGVDWQVGRLAPLVCRRHDEGRRTIITTNLVPRVADLPERARDKGAHLTVEHRYGDRLADRMTDARWSKSVACVGASLRGRAP